MRKLINQIISIGVYVCSWRRGLSLSIVSRCRSRHLSDPACLHCLCLSVSLYVSWSRVSPLGVVWRDELPRGQTLTSPSGPLHGCHLLAEPSSDPVCHARDRLGGGQRGCRGWGLGYIWAAGPTDACWSHRGPPWKHPPPQSSPTALLQLVVSRFILSDTYHHCLSCDLCGRGLWVVLTFTSELCRLSVGYV